jgi:signal peptidase II
VADLATKEWVFDWLGSPPSGDTYWIIPDALALKTSLNEGALFGMGQGQGGIFITLSILAVIGILYWMYGAGAARDRLLSLSLGCVTAGTLGNLYDRLGLPGLKWEYANTLHEVGEPVHAVRDWIYFSLIEWPIFNLADSFLVVGAGLLLWHAFWVTESVEEKSQL